MKRYFYPILSTLLAVFMLTGCGAAGSEAVSAASGSTLSEPPAVTAASDETDGVFTVPVALEGGSGRATIASPAEVRVVDGTYTAVICWSSPNYDFMMVDGERYDPVNTGGNSVFEIPIPSAECTIEVQADTTAMSQPHLVDYTLTFGGSTETAETAAVETAEAGDREPIASLEMTGSMELQYAEQFSVEHYAGGYSLVSIAGNEHRFLVVPEGAEVPAEPPGDVAVLQQPLTNIYMVATAAMDLFAACDGMSSIRFVGQRENDWAVDAAREAMADGSILYAGKYSAPDYERICAEGCSLAVENTMISHSPEVKEQLESLGIPVLIEHSSYESTPQGRMEWVKLYGLLTGHTEEAQAAFDAQIARFDELAGQEPTGKTVAFFFINTNGAAVVRRSTDYIPAMIELAGGTYAFPDLDAKDDSHSSTVAIQMEEFYAQVRDVDYLIYSSDITGALGSMGDLLAKCELLAECKAVQEGNVYCTTQNLYQSTMEMGDFVSDLHHLLTEDGADMTYLYQVK